MSWIRSGIEILRSQRSLAIVVWMKKPNDHAEPTKSRTLNLKKIYKKIYHINSTSSQFINSANVTQSLNLVVIQYFKSTNISKQRLFENVNK